MDSQTRHGVELRAEAVVRVGEGIDADHSAVRAGQLLQEACDDTGVTAEIEAGVKVEVFELSEINAPDEKLSQEGIAVARCGVDCIYIDVEVAAEQVKAKSTVHGVVGGVEFAFAKDSGGILKDSAIPAKRLRFRHGVPGLDYIIGETSQLLGHVAS